MKLIDLKVEEERAAALLGISTAELRRIAAGNGLGHAESQNGSNRLVFTYAELYRVCRTALQYPAS